MDLIQVSNCPLFVEILRTSVLGRVALT